MKSTLIDEATPVSARAVWSMFGGFVVGAAFLAALWSDVRELKLEMGFQRAIIASIATQVGAKIPDEGK